MYLACTSACNAHSDAQAPAAAAAAAAGCLSGRSALNFFFESSKTHRILSNGVKLSSSRNCDTR
jgi:hypothetical protein